MRELIPPVSPEQLPEDLRAQWEATPRPGLRSFIQVMAHAPDHFRRFNEVYGALRFDNHLDARLTELVRLAVARTTECQVCMAGRHPDAVAAGLTEELVDQLGGDARTGLTSAEDAAVAFAIAFATDHHTVDDDLLDALAAHFTPTQIVELALLSVMCLVGRFSMLLGLVEDASCALPTSTEP